MQEGTTYKEGGPHISLPHTPASFRSEEDPNAIVWTPRARTRKRLQFGFDSHAKVTSLAFAFCKVVVLLCAVVVGPVCCRELEFSPPERCLVVLLIVLSLNVFEVMPLYCTALFVPVLGTLCAVLGTQRSVVATSSLLAANIFNNVSFTVMGALAINAIFVKCHVARRFLKFVLARLSIDSAEFLLVLLLGSMFMSGVLYSASLMFLAVIEDVLASAPENAIHPNVAKRIMLAVAFSSNAGSTLLPISSPVNLITVTLLREFDHTVNLLAWVGCAVPCATLAMIGVWFAMLRFLPGPKERLAPGMEEFPVIHADTLADISPMLDDDSERYDLNLQQKTFLAIAIFAILGITVFAQELQPIIGHSACLSLAVVVAVFGSGFMSREEFLKLDWDLLVLVGGTNVMAFLVRETGLGATLTTAAVSTNVFTWLPYWQFLLLVISSTVLVSTCFGHSLTGVLIMPLIVALGVKLQAAEMTAMLVAIAIPMGMSLPHSSFDNMAALTTSKSLGRSNMELKQRDFRNSGFFITITAVVLIMSIGFGVSVMTFGHPPPIIVSETGTPEELKPKVVTENTPAEANEVRWSESVAHWKDFLKRPDRKAFAVSHLEPGMKSRAWAAAWGHKTQEEANHAALRECLRLVGEEEPPRDLNSDDLKCKIIYPSQEEHRRRRVKKELTEQATKAKAAMGDVDLDTPIDPKDKNSTENQHGSSLWSRSMDTGGRHALRQQRLIARLVPGSAMGPPAA